jgi:tetratricopeptide (TPR) repeat protein
MPQTTYMQRHPRHDHGFTIPDPLLTKQFGIPNACNRCHQDKDTDWSLAAVEKWYGPRMERRTRSRTTAIAKARRGDSDASTGLLGILAGDETPYWKASAALMLDRWIGTPAVNTALNTALRHDHPMVRTSAARVLEPLAEQDTTTRTNLEQLLNDPIRSVRITSAWSLRRQADPTSTAGRELLHMLTYNADQPSGQMQLSQYYLSRGDIQSAIDSAKRAITWDQGSPPFRHDLAVLLSMNGQTKEALQELRNAIRLQPNESEYHFKLALGLAEQNDLTGAEASFKETVRLEPRHARAWYNLGLLLNSKGQVPAALDALTKAEAAEPTQADFPYALATILLQQNRTIEASAAVSRALRARPDFREALQLQQMLSGQGR